MRAVILDRLEVLDRIPAGDRDLGADGPEVRVRSAWPRPPLPPVTSATLPSSRNVASGSCAHPFTAPAVRPGDDQPLHGEVEQHRQDREHDARREQLLHRTVEL